MIALGILTYGLLGALFISIGWIAVDTAKMVARDRRER